MDTDKIIAELKRQKEIIKEFVPAGTNPNLYINEIYIKNFLSGIQFCNQLEGSFSEQLARILKAVL